MIRPAACAALVGTALAGTVMATGGCSRGADRVKTVPADAARDIAEAHAGPRPFLVIDRQQMRPLPSRGWAALSGRRWSYDPFTPANHRRWLVLPHGGQGPRPVLVGLTRDGEAALIVEPIGADGGGLRLTLVPARAPAGPIKVGSVVIDRSITGRGDVWVDAAPDAKDGGDIDIAPGRVRYRLSLQPPTPEMSLSTNEPFGFTLPCGRRLLSINIGAPLSYYTRYDFDLRGAPFDKLSLPRSQCGA